MIQEQTVQNRKSMYAQERKTLLSEVDSILRWDKRDLARWEHAAWRLVRWAIVKLTN